MNQTAINRTMTPFEWGMLITLSVLWGGSFFFVEVALETLNPVMIVWLRVSLAAVALLVGLALVGRNPVRLLPFMPAFLGMSVLNNVIPFMAFAWGQTHIASGLAAILNATTPFFTVLVAHIFLADERASARHWVGIAIGFAGVATIFGTSAFLGDSALANWGKAACIGAALSYGFAGAYGRRFREMDLTPVETAAGQVTGSAVLLLPMMLIFGAPGSLFNQSLTIWAAILGLALVSTAFAYILFFRILATAGATNIMLVTFLVPASAILLGATILGEVLEQRHYAGLALIGLGLVVIDGRLVGRFRGT